MITEDYVSFELVKLLKKKGFDGPCYKVWESHGESSTLVGASYFVEGETVVNRESVDAAAKYYAYEYNLNNKVEGYLAPTLQLTMKWLREVHRLDIDISIEYTPKKVYFYSIFKKTVIRDIDCLHSETNFDSYEKACEAAIRYTLENLI